VDINLRNLTPDIRYLNDMHEVIFDQEWLKSASNFELYYMYRGIEEKNELRYDITIIPQRILGKEFTKTKGHYHIGKYKEVYMVLRGQSIYLMQKKRNNTEDEIEDVYAVKCQKGDVIVIPSDYGHITINPSSTEEIKMANWISKDCKSDYSLFEKLRGACYYYIKSPSSSTDSSGSKSWVKNENYKSVPKLRFEEPLKSVPENLEFLKQR